MSAEREERGQTGRVREAFNSVIPDFAGMTSSREFNNP
jgi:hypothetical protein